MIMWFSWVFEALVTLTIILRAQEFLMQGSNINILNLLALRNKIVLSLANSVGQFYLYCR